MFIICLLGIWFTNKRGITGDQSQIPPDQSEWTGRWRSHETWLKIFCKSNSLWSPQPSISFSFGIFFCDSWISCTCSEHLQPLQILTGIYNPYSEDRRRSIFRVCRSPQDPRCALCPKSWRIPWTFTAGGNWRVLIRPCTNWFRRLEVQNGFTDWTFGVAEFNGLV
jgi:hypothetical protein